MDGYLVMRSLGALALVLGTCAGALWFVRRFRIALPGLPVGPQGRRLALVERISIDSRSTIVLLRRDDREHLIALTPDGTTIIEQGIPAQSSPEPVCVTNNDTAAQPVPISLPHIAQAARALVKRWPELHGAVFNQWNQWRERIRARFAGKNSVEVTS